VCLGGKGGGGECRIETKRLSVQVTRFYVEKKRENTHTRWNDDKTNNNKKERKATKKICP
jgi:hypothetical protein